MAKKNMIWLSVIIVIIIAAFIWLTQSLQWRSYIDAVEQETIPLIENNNQVKDEIKELNITALIPPSESFNQTINNLSLTDPIHIKVNYIDHTQMTFESYKNYLLTEESGDVHLLPNEWILPLAVQGFLMPLDRLLTSEYVEEQTVALTESMRWNSHLWSAPYQIDPYIVIPHISLSTYFAEANLFNETITDVIDNEENDENGDHLTDINEEEVTITPTTSPTQQKLTTTDIIDKILSDIDSSAILVNSERNNANQLFHFIHYLEQNEVHSGNMLTNRQYDILTKLYEQHYTISENSVGDILENEQLLPLFLVTTWSELSQHYEKIKHSYDVSYAEIPIYWTNGYSFVIRHQSKHQQSAGQWIEALNKKMSEQQKTDVGMPIHNSNLNGLNEEWQQQISALYNEPFNISSFMNVSPSWPIYYEQLNKYWLSDEPLLAKINLWLEEQPMLIE